MIPINGNTCNGCQHIFQFSLVRLAPQCPLKLKVASAETDRGALCPRGCALPHNTVQGGHGLKGRVTLPKASLVPP